MPCTTLDWDTEFFGFPLARVNGDRLTAGSAARVDAWCRERAVRCLVFFASADCADTQRLTRELGYDLVDVRVTASREVASTPVAGEWRLAREADVPALRDIAISAHHDSRFYFDPRFSRRACDALYATWIESSVRGWADVVVTCGPEGEPAGYVTGHLEGSRGRMGLVGVRAGERGAGYGRTLVDAACSWLAQHGAERVSVVTQGRNVRALRFYQRAGFLTDQIELVYHRWFDDV